MQFCDPFPPDIARADPNDRDASWQPATSASSRQSSKMSPHRMRRRRPARGTAVHRRMALAAASISKQQEKLKLPMHNRASRCRNAHGDSDTSCQKEDFYSVGFLFRFIPA